MPSPGMDQRGGGGGGEYSEGRNWRGGREERLQGLYLVLGGGWSTQRQNPEPDLVVAGTQVHAIEIGKSGEETGEKGQRGADLGRGGSKRAGGELNPREVSEAVFN